MKTTIYTVIHPEAGIVGQTLLFEGQPEDIAYEILGEQIPLDWQADLDYELDIRYFNDNLPQETA